jgi:chitinase
LLSEIPIFIFDCFIIYLSSCADWLNVQTYDYRGSRDKIAEHHSSLMQATSAEGDDKYLNQDSVIKYMVNTGIEPSKLLVGIPAFGKKFRLTSDLHDLGSPATSVGSVPYTEVRNELLK